MDYFKQQHRIYNISLTKIELYAVYCFKLSKLKISTKVMVIGNWFLSTALSAYIYRM